MWHLYRRGRVRTFCAQGGARDITQSFEFVTPVVLEQKVFRGRPPLGSSFTSIVLQPKSEPLMRVRQESRPSEA